MRLLAATVAEIPGQSGPAIETSRSGATRLAGMWLDGARYDAARHRFADTLQPVHARPSRVEAGPFMPYKRLMSNSGAPV
jgi:hypothetical protein